MGDKQVTRRGLLSLLGLGAAGAAASGITLVGGKAIGTDKTMFRYVCDCGNGIAAEVPKEEGESLSLKCECGVTYKLTWLGDHFSVASDFERPEVEFDKETMPEFAKTDMTNITWSESINEVKEHARKSC